MHDHNTSRRNLVLLGWTFEILATTEWDTDDNGRPTKDEMFLVLSATCPAGIVTRLPKDPEAPEGMELLADIDANMRGGDGEADYLIESLKDLCA